MKINVEVNGRQRLLDVQNGDYLLEVLRAADCLSVRRGCDSTSCGVCTVLVDGKPVPSCSYLAIRADGHRITTVEGIAAEAENLANHFGAEGADQCGYCNPSFALVAYALKQTNPDATDDEIREWLVGNLCRCSGYQSQLLAIRHYLEDRS